MTYGRNNFRLWDYWHTMHWVDGTFKWRHCFSCMSSLCVLFWKSNGCILNTVSYQTKGTCRINYLSTSCGVFQVSPIMIGKNIYTVIHWNIISFTYFMIRFWYHSRCPMITSLNLGAHHEWTATVKKNIHCPRKPFGPQHDNGGTSHLCQVITPFINSANRDQTFYITKLPAPINYSFKHLIQSRWSVTTDIWF